MFLRREKVDTEAMQASDCKQGRLLFLQGREALHSCAAAVGTEQPVPALLLVLSVGEPTAGFPSAGGGTAWVQGMELSAQGREGQSTAPACVLTSTVTRLWTLNVIGQN